MKKIIMLFSLIILTIPMFSNPFKKHVTAKWVYDISGRRVEITFRDDKSFTYLEKQTSGEKSKVIYNLDGDYKLRGRYIYMAFSNKKTMKLTMLQMFFGSNTTDYIIRDNFGRTYRSVKPKIEVKKGEEKAGGEKKEKDKASSDKPAGNQAGENQ